MSEPFSFQETTFFLDIPVGQSAPEHYGDFRFSKQKAMQKTKHIQPSEGGLFFAGPTPVCGRRSGWPSSARSVYSGRETVDARGPGWASRP